MVPKFELSVKITDELIQAAASTPLHRDLPGATGNLQQIKLHFYGNATLFFFLVDEKRAGVPQGTNTSNSIDLSEPWQCFRAHNDDDDDDVTLAPDTWKYMAVWCRRLQICLWLPAKQFSVVQGTLVLWVLHGSLFLHTAVFRWAVGRSAVNCRHGFSVSFSLHTCTFLRRCMMCMDFFVACSSLNRWSNPSETLLLTAPCEWIFPCVVHPSLFNSVTKQSSLEKIPNLFPQPVDRNKEGQTTNLGYFCGSTKWLIVFHNWILFSFFFYFLTKLAIWPVFHILPLLMLTSWAILKGWKN